MKSTISRGDLIRLVLKRLIPALIIIPMLFFLPAWSFNYWEAWVYIICLLIPMSLIFTYLIINDPELLVRRLKFREKQKDQKLIILFSYPVFLLAFILPGFDHRFGWSNVPPWVVILALFIFFVGYAGFFMVLRENSYVSRIIEVSEGQKVISTGPYSIVRHPMYICAILIYLASPLALGSYWAMIPAALILPVFIVRILTEEKVLRKDLPGYQEYTQKVKYRLLPLIW